MLRYGNYLRIVLSAGSLASRAGICCWATRAGARESKPRKHQTYSNAEGQPSLWDRPHISQLPNSPGRARLAVGRRARTSPRRKEQRRMTTLHLDDLAPGQIYPLGSRTLSRDEIVAFARDWDPQPFHLDEKAAVASIY